ncbi:hypothetical protein QF028_004874 [Neobacillus sp. B4I6]
MEIQKTQKNSCRYFHGPNLGYKMENLGYVNGSIKHFFVLGWKMKSLVSFTVN